jgi:putative phosphoserine phosphatase / 1-acylglycerol-3-phosphate O-acyltransferase
MNDVEALIEEIEQGPEGPEVGAFFDLDGTLIAGYSASVFYQEFIRRRQMSAVDIARSVGAALDQSVRGSDVSRLVEIAAGSFRGRPEEELTELGERLFVQRIAGMIYPDSRRIVRAHQRMGHTVALASSATRYQVAQLADDFGIEHLLTTVLEVVDGVFTGALGGDVLWGPAKARAVRAFAKEHGVDLRRSYGYGNGDEDMYFLDAVGFPRALNPQPGLTKVAADRGWPAYRLSGGGRPGLESVVRTGAALAGLGTAAAAGVAVGLLKRNRRDGANFATSVGSDAALALAGVHLDVVGEENLWSQRPAVFIFNHQSSIDMPVLGALVRRDLTGVAKKEAARDPRFAPVGFLVDVAYVDRGNTKQAKEALAPVVEKLREGVSIGIAPEGTRSPTPRLGRFKKGAFHIAMQAGVPIVPIVIRNAGEMMWKGSPFIRKGTIDVAVLPPIATRSWRVKELDERVAAIRGRYLDTLDNWPRNGG